ncbi:hypothetical protein FIBSPDRAFT_875492 [Athelia psychrophila]|uniref:Uncharacterized protein n=1 Tax=Athelia psychrophila TaxID=1759441 RepID=A0A167XN39_9AGAM|nr:hypothetical protein FIBSPDRAFT_875492 [Fibularhizoctonia sp. CBS 109695]
MPALGPPSHIQAHETHRTLLPLVLLPVLSFGLVLRTYGALNCVLHVDAFVTWLFNLALAPSAIPTQAKASMIIQGFPALVVPAS